MAEIVYIQPPMTQQTAAPEGTFERFFRYFLYLVLIGLLIGAIVAAYLVIENWEWLVTTFTTGFLGWLNPFDDNRGDTGPTEVASDTLGTALSLAYWWPPNWFR